MALASMRFKELWQDGLVGSACVGGCSAGALLARCWCCFWCFAGALLICCWCFAVALLVIHLVPVRAREAQMRTLKPQVRTHCPH